MRGKLLVRAGNFFVMRQYPQASNTSAAEGTSRATGGTLAGRLDGLTRPGELFLREGEKIRCVACGHRCLIAEGRRGVCKVRFYEGGELRVPFGYTAGAQCDPVEKKPFYHVYPGSDALTFGMLGCDFHCSYCQNWVTSQALRDDAAHAPVREVSAEALAQAGVRLGAKLVVSSYNEPLITAEWAVAVFREARALGIACAFVSNGNATPEALDYLQPHITAYKVDLKCFNDRHYRSLGGTLERVTQTIRDLSARSVWVEVVTLLIPGFNDSAEEVRDMAQFLAGVSRDIPWHVTAFHPDYNMRDRRQTRADELVRAAETGAEAGLRHVYAGNAPGRVGPWENTLCGGCGRVLIRRHGYHILEAAVTPDGACATCGHVVPGVGIGQAKLTDPQGTARWPQPVLV